MHLNVRDSRGLLQSWLDSFVVRSKSQDTGLGLAVCKRLVEQHHGGRIVVLNNFGGRGVTFVVTLPVEPAGAAAS